MNVSSVDFISSLISFIRRCQFGVVDQLPTFNPFNVIEMSVFRFQILGQRANKERAILEASTEDIYEHHLERILAGSLEPGVVGVIGPENPVIRAALDGSSPLTAVEMMGQSSLLRNVIGNELSFKEKLKFSSDPSMNIEEDQIIRDDLSERLFGEFGLEKDLNVEDDFQLGRNNILGHSWDVIGTLCIKVCLFSIE